ncbi:hypothetical protein CNECB9_4220001 [Cupriavidus necator]|uniref:Uncharacterized protein n=1 Tax=Cupriavidus necator TaxID=106590 RepID=A0A1K0IKZ3_CUPNE|nr:hypothetical protein CNECB9_4220001 [Cupriavidus necator]
MQNGFEGRVVRMVSGKVTEIALSSFVLCARLRRMGSALRRTIAPGGALERTSGQRTQGVSPHDHPQYQRQRQDP